MEDADLVIEYKLKLDSAENLLTEYKTKLQAAEAKIAEIDSTLTNKNVYCNELNETINDLEKKHQQMQNDYTVDLEELKQKNYALQKKLDVQASLERSMISEVESMREKLNQEEQKSSQGNDLKKEKMSLKAKLEESNEQIQSLEAEVEDLKRRVNEGGSAVAREQPVHEVSGYLDQITGLMNENSGLNENISKTKIKLSAVEEELEVCQKEVKALKKSFEEAQTAAEMYKQQSTEYRDYIEASKEENMELRVELEGLKASAGGGFSEKGNSLFSEVDDERQKLHDRIIKLKESYQAMKHKYQSMAENLASYKMKLASALSLNATSQGDKLYIQKLRDSLSKSVAQVKSLTQSLEEAQKETPEKEIKQGIDSVVNKLREEKSQLEKELRSSRLSYLMISDQKLDIEYKWKQSEEACKQLKGDIIKLNVKLEEKSKQTEDAANCAVVKKPITERIPTTPKEEFVLRERCARPERLKMENQKAKENVEELKRGKDSDEVFTDASPKLKKKKKVAISETVELQYDCGRKESGSVSEEEKKPLKRAGRKIDLSTKQANQVPNECKQQ